MRKTVELERAMAIMRVVSEVKQLSVDEMISTCRVKPLPYVRSLAVYFILTTTASHRPSVAKMFGFKSKCSVFNCFHAIRQQSEMYDDVRTDVTLIANRLKEAI